MDGFKRREVASRGGRVAHERGTAHEWTREEAREAGRKGGAVLLSAGARAVTWRRIDDLAAELDDIAARFDERKDDRGAANARVIAIMRQSVEKVVAAIDRMER
jgi:general stress protein YciG